MQVKKGKLKAAVAMGTAALLWSIPSLNIFGVVAMIISWGAYGGGRKKDALLSGIFYIIAFIVSIIFCVVSLKIMGGLVAGGSGGVERLMNIITVMSLIGGALYITAAVFSFLGAKELTGSEGKGYFD